MKGRVIAYEEDFKEPYWQPESPLKSDTRYFWSVRLREGGADVREDGAVCTPVEPRQVRQGSGLELRAMEEAGGQAEEEGTG